MQKYFTSGKQIHLEFHLLPCHNRIHKPTKRVMLKKIILAAPRGPCAGVNRAIAIVEQALAKYGSPIYVNHELVHNRHVVDDFSKRGVIFSYDPENVPLGSVYLFSAHGVSPQFRERARLRGLKLIDATCPLVTKVHDEAKKLSEKNDYIFFIGHRGHPEVTGTTGVTAMHVIESTADVHNLDPATIPRDRGLAILTQTTLSVDETSVIINALKAKFPGLRIPSSKDICYATTNRQQAVRELAQHCDFITVVGSQNSSNSNRLVEAAQNAGCDAILIENISDIPASKLHSIRTLGISSGASVPEVLVNRLLSELGKLSPGVQIANLEILRENVVFPLPEI